MQVVLVELFHRFCLHLDNLLDVILIVDAVAQQISEIPQRPLQPIRGALFLRFFESHGLALCVVDRAVANILVVSAISKSDAHDNGQSYTDALRLRILVGKVDLYVLYRG